MGHKVDSARVGRLASAIALVLSGTTVTWGAFGQEPAAAAGDQRLDEEITVTGSRIRRDDFSSAQPTTSKRRYW